MEKKWLEGLDEWLLFFGIIITTFIVALIFHRLFGRFLKKSSSVIQNDPTNYQFLHHFLTAIIYLIGFSMAVYMVPNLRMVASSLLAGAGILAVAVGFASQQALSNIVSGVFIVMFKPFRINDRLRIRDNLSGIVEDITLRHTVIRNIENRRIIIPNSIINQEVIINATLNDEKIQKRLEIPISYQADIDKARAIITEEAMKHPLKIDGRNDKQKAKGRPEVLVRVVDLGAYAVTLRAYVWAANHVDAFAMGCDLLESIKKRFDVEGIEIPYPYHNLIHKNEFIKYNDNGKQNVNNDEALSD
ncbi:MAG: mechanosensitive ion channel family protein [Saprospiraceae bacterium]